MIVTHNIELEAIDRKFKSHLMFDEKTKVFGSFDEEFDESNNVTYINGKKSWASFAIGEDGITWCKRSMKGVPKSALILDMADPLVQSFVQKDKIINQKIASNYELQQLQHKIVNTRFGNDYNTMLLFQRLCAGQDVFIMNYQFIRDAVTSTIYGRFIIKKIQPGANI